MAPETRQQIIALVLGIIFIIGLILFAQRLGKFIASRQQRSEIASQNITPTPTPQAKKIATTATPMLTQQRVVNGKVQTILMQKGGQPSSIPQTGPETSILFSLVGLLGLGTFLRRQKPQS